MGFFARSRAVAVCLVLCNAVRLSQLIHENTNLLFLLLLPHFLLRLGFLFTLTGLLGGALRIWFLRAVSTKIEGGRIVTAAISKREHEPTLLD